LAEIIKDYGLWVGCGLGTQKVVGK